MILRAVTSLCGSRQFVFGLLGVVLYLSFTSAIPRGGADTLLTQKPCVQKAMGCLVTHYDSFQKAISTVRKSLKQARNGLTYMRQAEKSFKTACKLGDPILECAGEDGQQCEIPLGEEKNSNIKLTLITQICDIGSQLFDMASQCTNTAALFSGDTSCLKMYPDALNGPGAIWQERLSEQQLPTEVTGINTPVQRAVSDYDDEDDDTSYRVADPSDIRDGGSVRAESRIDKRRDNCRQLTYFTGCNVMENQRQCGVNTTLLSYRLLVLFDQLTNSGCGAEDLLPTDPQDLYQEEERRLRTTTTPAATSSAPVRPEDIIHVSMAAVDSSSSVYACSLWLLLIAIISP